MLATISPVSTHVDETLATLRYACQARKIINRVRVNEVPHAPVARSQTADVAKFDVLREQYEEHMKVCHQSSETQRLREELETLRRQHDDHMRGCTSPQGACLRAACAEDRRQAELQLTEHRSRHAEAVSQLKAQLAHRLSDQSAEQQLELGELKEELSAARKEYEDHLRCCRLVDGPQPEKLREELQQVTAQLSKIRSLTSEIEVLRISRDDCQVKCAELETMCKEHEKQLTELELQRMQEQSYFGSQLENFCVQLGSVQARIDDLPHYESQPLPHGEFEFSIDAHTRALMKKLMSAVSEDYANPSDCEYSMSLDDTVSYLFTKDHTETLCKKSSVSSQLNTTSGRLSTDMDESSDCLDNSQSFVSQNSSSVGNAKESVEEILYYLQDKSNMLKELCPEKNYSAAVAAFDQALYELREALQGESLPDLSQHFSPPSPSVTPAKSSLRSPAALRAPTPKSVTFRMRTGADS